MYKSTRNDFIQLQFWFEEVKGRFIRYWGRALSYWEVHISTCQKGKYHLIAHILKAGPWWRADPLVCWTISVIAWFLGEKKKIYRQNIFLQILTFIASNNNRLRWFFNTLSDRLALMTLPLFQGEIFYL